MPTISTPWWAATRAPWCPCMSTPCALDLMYEHLRSGAALPPSQVVRARARASASAMLDDSHLPAIATQPAAADLIALQPGRIDVPN